MPMTREKWDVKAWVITILLGLVLSLGGYSVRSLREDVEKAKESVARVDKVAADLVIRQAVDDTRFVTIQIGISEVQNQVKDLRDLLIKTHMPQAKQYQ